ncbi:hypothetical protein GCM10023172_17140 [Hymenobacter ginsengisoli]|uniref:TonB-dependent receptor n=1 Tax=Hymenobacter ginsengisoli TaxID=1051626 RepID=A0ABP8QAJ4_9BACT|nr:MULTISPECIES: hypothetical protein [unclassified Hymenobacter]MBO2030743.1 hypothetical protein [Hymenobacter sp. BT559]
MKRLQVIKSSFTAAAGRPLLLAAGLSGTVVFGAHAQGQPGKGKARGTIQDAEIEIVKDRVNTLPEATRNFEKIRLAPPPKPTRQVTYTYPDFRLPATRLNPSVQVLTVAQEELEPLTGNYVKLGLGNYGSVYGRAHLHSTRNEQYSYGLDVRHNSSKNGPVDGQNSGVSLTSATATGEYYLGRAAVGAALDFARDTYHFYGYDRSKLTTEPNPDDIKQTFTRFGARAYARNRATDAALQYEVGLGYKYFGDHYGVSENNLLLNAKAGYALSETSRITLDAQGSFISEKQPLGLVGQSGDLSRTRNFFQATPAYELTGKTGLSLTLGATLGYSSDALYGVGKGMINPAVRVGYAVVPEKFQLYAGLGGAIQRVTRYDLSQENPWLAPGQTLADTHAGPTVYGGFTSTPVSGLELAARATFGRSRNLYFYRNSLADSSKFDLVYDSTTINVVNVHAEALYSASEKVRVGFKADYNHYGVKSLAQAYGRPAFLGTLYGTYNASDKLLLGVNFYYYSANYGVGYVPGVTLPVPAPRTAVDRQTNSVIDLSLRADYRITPKFSIFALGNNLTNRHYQRYLNYQSQGINVIGGVTYSF